MADFEMFLPCLRRLEGNGKDFATARVAARLAWTLWQADRIDSRRVAAMLADWTLMWGRWGVVMPQAMLGLVPDGVVGDCTLQAVNGCDAGRLSDRLHESRRRFYFRLVQRYPEQRACLDGWLRRLDRLRLFHDGAGLS